MEGSVYPGTLTEIDVKSHRSRLYGFMLVTIATVAAVGIGMSSYALFNMRGVETSALEASSSVAFTSQGVVPAVVTVKKGDTVTWTNQSDAQHQLVLTSPNLPQDLGGFEVNEPLAEGDSYSYIFETAGTYTYDDPSAPLTAQGTIIVEDE
jgi:plastocyanin